MCNLVLLILLQTVGAFRNLKFVAMRFAFGDSVAVTFARFCECKELDPPAHSGLLDGTAAENISKVRELPSRGSNLTRGRPTAQIIHQRHSKPGIRMLRPHIFKKSFAVLLRSSLITRGT